MIRLNRKGFFLCAAILLETPNNLINDKTCNLSILRLRVDLQVEIIRKRQPWLADVKTPFDNTYNLQNSRKANAVKYEELRVELKERWE